MQNNLGAAQQLEPNVLIVILIRRLMIGGVLGPQNEKNLFLIDHTIVLLLLS